MIPGFRYCKRLGGRVVGRRARGFLLNGAFRWEGGEGEGGRGGGRRREKGEGRGRIDVEEGDRGGFEGEGGAREMEV